jgi:hypothetical protein
MKLRLARRPDRLSDQHPVIIEEFLELAVTGKTGALSMMIAMLADLYEHGRDSRYLAKLKQLPIHELRSASRGGLKGGARIYLFFLANGDAGIVNCEVKEDDSPEPAKLEVALEVLVAYRRGVRVFG